MPRRTTSSERPLRREAGLGPGHDTPYAVRRKTSWAEQFVAGQCLCQWNATVRLPPFAASRWLCGAVGWLSLRARPAAPCWAFQKARASVGTRSSRGTGPAWLFQPAGVQCAQCGSAARQLGLKVLQCGSTARLPGRQVVFAGGLVVGGGGTGVWRRGGRQIGPSWTWSSSSAAAAAVGRPWWGPVPDGRPAAAACGEVRPHLAGLPPLRASGSRSPLGTTRSPSLWRSRAQADGPFSRARPVVVSPRC